MVCTILRRYTSLEAQALVERSFGSFVARQATEAAARAREAGGAAAKREGGGASLPHGLPL